MAHPLRWFVVALLLSLGILACPGTTPIQDGFPCLTDQDCGPLFCRGFLCVAEPCAKASRACFAGSSGCTPDGEAFKCNAPCRSGTQSCQNGFWGACTGQILPKAEECNGQDDDCDGQTDESFAQQDQRCPIKDTSGNDLGVDGVFTCKDGKVICEADGAVIIRAKSQSFKLGSPVNSPGHQDDEKEVQAQFGYTFAIGQREVTQGEFKTLMGYNPSQGTISDNAPVNNISWHEAALYTNLLSQSKDLTPCFDCSGTFTPGTPYKGTCAVTSTFDSESLYVLGCPGYRIPTEAEWSFAYKAGEGLYKSFYNGDLQDASSDTCAGDTTKDAKDDKLEQIAHYCFNSGGAPKAAGGLTPNAWQLFDMSGNVAEWTFDFYDPNFAGPSNNRMGPRTGTNKTIKGGHFASPPRDCRGAARAQQDPNSPSPNIGLRIARTILEKTQ